MNFSLYIKTKLKKYLPNFIYRRIYSLYIHIKNIRNSNEKDLTLVNFTEPIFKRVIVEEVSFDIKIDPNNGCVDKEIYKNGVWEKEMLLEIKKHINKESVCLDIGSNIGQHAMFMAVTANKGDVYAFEPIKKLCSQIQESVQINSIKNIHVCNFGLSNKDDRQKIYLDNLNMGKTSFEKNVNTSSSIEYAELKKFDTFWNNRKKVDFVKIDVEGYEYYTLLGMKESIEKYHPTIIFEFSPHFYKQMDFNSVDILNFLSDFGYMLYDLENNNNKVAKENFEDFIKNTKIQTNLLCV